jgi:hypothetical protein
VLDVNARLVHILRSGGADEVFDLDNLLKREALDVIGDPLYSASSGGLSLRTNMALVHKLSEQSRCACHDFNAHP